MNHIKYLQSELAARESRAKAASLAIAEFQAHLLSPKFQGFDPDGSPRAWIATADVNAWLSRVSDGLHGL